MGNFRNIYVCVVLLSLLGFGAIGFIDDYLEGCKKESKGPQAHL